MEVISIDDASSSIEVEGGAGSDVEEVIHWDRELRRTSTFVTAVMILSGRAYSSPTLADQQKVLLRFVDEPAEIYFKRNSTQASAFKNIMFDCKSGWKPGQTEAARMANIKKKWKVRFVAEQLALLLVLRRQVEKAKKEKEEIEQQRTLRSESASASAGGVPKNNALKRAFFKLWKMYETPLKNYVVAEKKRENATYRTPSLSFQLNGQRAQDLVPWGTWLKCPANCPSCGHTSTMPLQSPKEVVAENARRRAAADAIDGGDGKIKGVVDKSGCYCFFQNCFGDEDGIGCWRCFELARTTKSDEDAQPSGEMAQGICRFECDVCRCDCQVTFDECKRQTIATGLTKNALKNSKTTVVKKKEAQRAGGRSLWFEYVKTNLDNDSVRAYQDVDHRTECEVADDVLTGTAIKAACNAVVQCNPNVMRGLQEVIPRQNTIEVTPTQAAGGKRKKVSMSYHQARDDLLERRGRRKSPPEIPTLSDNTPPASIFLRNAGNRFHRNGLSSVPMNPHGEQAGASVAVTAAATVPTGPAKLDRVGKKVLEKFMDPTTTPGTKKIVARTHSKIANRDPAMTKMVDLFEFQCTQEVAETCIDLERNMG